MLNSDYVLSSKNTISEKFFFSGDPQTQSFSCIVTGCDSGAPAFSAALPSFCSR